MQYCKKKNGLIRLMFYFENESAAGNENFPQKNMKR